MNKKKGLALLLAAVTVLTGTQPTEAVEKFEDAEDFYSVAGETDESITDLAVGEMDGSNTDSVAGATGQENLDSGIRTIEEEWNSDSANTIGEEFTDSETDQVDQGFSSSTIEENNEISGYDQVLSGTIAGEASEDGIALFSIEEYTDSYGAQLEGNSKALYDQMVQNYVVNYQDFLENIEFDFTLTTPISYDAVVENGKYQSTGESYQTAVKELKYMVQAATDAFAYDYPQAFWFRGCGYRFGGSYKSDSSSSTGYTGAISKITFKPGDYEIFENAHAQMGDFMNAVQDAVALLKNETSGMSQYEKVRAVHDYICKKVTYKNDGTLLVHTAAPAFIGDSQAFVCEGYAKSMKILCHYLGINCACVSGTAKSTLNGNAGAHMWNYVQMEDCKWYLVDATWDDSKDITEPAVPSKYLLVGKKSKGLYITIAEERNEYTSFSTASEGSISPKYILPVLADDAYIDRENTPSVTPTQKPDETPSVTPTQKPDETPSVTPTQEPDKTPSVTPTQKPDETPSVTPTQEPDKTPSATPTQKPDETPSVTPTQEPDKTPSVTPTEKPDKTPIPTPTPEQTTPTPVPTMSPVPTLAPTSAPAPAKPQTLTESLPLKVKQTYKVSGKIKSVKTSSKKIATVDKTGKITGKKAGTATITITFTNKTKKIYKVKVQKGTVKTSSIRLNKTKVILAKKGKIFRLKVALTPVTSQQKVTYKSSKPKVAAITSSGKIIAKKKGTATITVKSGSKKVTCKVIVKK